MARDAKGCLLWGLKLLGLAVLGFAALLFVVGLIADRKGAETKPAPVSAAPTKPVETERAPEPAPAPEPPKPARVGCVLSIPGHTGSVPVLPTEEGFDEYGKAAAQGLDDRSMLTVLVSNGGFLVEKGTPCLAVDSGFISSRVRVLSGPHAGKAGWVPNEWRSGG